MAAQPQEPMQPGVQIPPENPPPPGAGNDTGTSRPQDTNAGGQPQTPEEDEQHRRWRELIASIIEAINVVHQQNGASNPQAVAQRTLQTIQALETANGGMNFSIPRETPKTLGLRESLIYTIATKLKPNPAPDGSGVNFTNSRGAVHVTHDSIRFQTADGHRFSAEDACNIAALAILSGNYRGRKIDLNGDDEQKRLIQAAIYEANKLLPKEMRIKIDTPVRGVLGETAKFKEHLMNLPDFRAIAEARITAEATAEAAQKAEKDKEEELKKIASLKILDLTDKDVQKLYYGYNDKAKSKDNYKLLTKGSALALVLNKQNDGLTGKDVWQPSAEDLSDQLKKDKQGFAQILVDEESNTVQGIIAGHIFKGKLNDTDDKEETFYGVSYTIAVDDNPAILNRLFKEAIDKSKPLFFESSGDAAELRTYANSVEVPIDYEQSRYANTTDHEPYKLRAVFPEGYTDEQKSKATLAYLKAKRTFYDQQAENLITGEIEHIGAPTAGTHNPRNEQLLKYEKDKLADPSVWAHPLNFAHIKLPEAEEEELSVSPLAQRLIIKNINEARASENATRGKKEEKLEMLTELDVRKINHYWNSLTDDEKAKLERDSIKKSNLTTSEQEQRHDKMASDLGAQLSALTQEELDLAVEPTDRKAVSKLTGQAHPVFELKLQPKSPSEIADIEAAKTTVQFIKLEDGNVVFVSMSPNDYARGGYVMNNNVFDWTIMKESEPTPERPTPPAPEAPSAPPRDTSNLKLSELTPEEQQLRTMAASVNAYEVLHPIPKETLKAMPVTTDVAVSTLDKKSYPIREISMAPKGLPETAETTVRFILKDDGSVTVIGFVGNEYMKDGKIAHHWDINPPAAPVVDNAAKSDDKDKGSADHSVEPKGLLARLFGGRAKRPQRVEPQAAPLTGAAAASYDDAVEAVRAVEADAATGKKQVSESILQRQFGLANSDAVNLMRELEAKGVVGKMRPGGYRDVLDPAAAKPGVAPA